MQRLRLRFSRGKELKYISHLDLMRLWHRALRRAGVPLAYSQGFSPHPRLSLAAPLAIGVTSSSELMDVFLERRVSTYSFMKAITEQLPAGIELLEVIEIGLAAPSLQSQVQQAEYVVELDRGKGPADLQTAVRSLLEADTLPWQHSRDKEIRKYDLRELIDHIWVIAEDEACCTLGMRLRCDSRGSGRPEQVAAALGFGDQPRLIHRGRLLLAQRK